MPKLLPQQAGWLVFCAAIIAYFGWQNLPDLRAEEPRRAVISMEMAASNDWITPRIHGEPYYNKPPLFNWVQAGLVRFFNSSSERLMRFPSLLSFFLIAFTIWLTQRKTDTHKATASMIFFLVTADILFYGGINSGEIDLFFSLLIFLQGILFHHYSIGLKPDRMYVLSYTLCALAFLTKGPPALVFHMLTVFGWLSWRRDWKMLFHPWHLAGIAILLSVCGIYFYLYELNNGNSIAYLGNLLAESGQKAGLERSLMVRLRNVLTYFPNLIFIALPGTLMFVFLVDKRNWPELPRLNSLERFCLFTLLINIPVYMLAGRFVARYQYLFLPFIAILAAYAYQHLINIKGENLLKRILLLAVPLCGITAVIMTYRSAVNPHLWIAIFSLSTIALFFAHQKSIIGALPALAMCLILMRMVYNVGVLHTVQEKTDYPALCAHWLELTGGQPILLTGTKEMLPTASIKISSDTLFVPPLLPYQIPYYLMRIQQIPMRYEPAPRGGQCSLSPEIPSRKHQLLEVYYDHWQGRNLYLIKHL